MKTVMLTLVIHGMTVTRPVSYDRLMDAIAVVESNRGATSANVYQLRPIYVRDISRVSGKPLTFAQATGSDAMARWCIVTYWDYYGWRYYIETGKRPTAEVLARMHNGGPDGWKRRATLPYWWRVKKVLSESAR